MSFTIMNDVKIGVIPPTPTSIDQVPNIEEATTSLKRIAYAHGLPTSYKQEQNGKLIQNIFPIKQKETRQISSSSKTELQLHTETAFHSYPPSHVILMCLRGDPAAFTTYALVDDIILTLDEETLSCLKEPLFVTAVDESFRMNGEPNKNILLPILTDTKDGTSICFDEFYMRGKTFQAQEALDKLLISIKKNTKEIALKEKDVLIIDNHKVIHGRKSFQARYDGTDRWLLRVLTISKTPPDTQYIYENHMIITTEL